MARAMRIKSNEHTCETQTLKSVPIKLHRGTSPSNSGRKSWYHSRDNFSRDVVYNDDQGRKFWQVFFKLHLRLGIPTRLLFSM